MCQLLGMNANTPTDVMFSCTWRELLPQPAAHGTTKLWSVERRHPFAATRLADDDLSIDFAAHTTPSDRVAVIATEPLTHDEGWSPFACGELRLFQGGVQALR